MRIVVSAVGATLNALASPNFAGCPFFAFVEPETMDVEAVPNPAAEAMWDEYTDKFYQIAPLERVNLPAKERS